MLDAARQAFLAALARMQADDLADWAKTNPNQFFSTLLKLIPEAELRGEQAALADISDVPVNEAEWTRRAGD